MRHLVASGETSLPRLLRLFDRISAQYSMSTIGDQGQFTGEVRMVPVEDPPKAAWATLGENKPYLFCGQVHQLPYNVQLDWLALVVDAVDCAECVMELGSGYGRQLFELYLRGVNPELRYIAAEPTAEGRALTQWLAQLVPDMPLEVADFSFEKPDFAHLHPHHFSVVFSAWSVMYAANMSDVFFTELAAVPGEVFCLFFEPLGFQISADNSHRLYQQQDAQESGHNLNFHHALMKAADSGLIRLHYIGQDYFAPDIWGARSAMSLWVFSKPANAPV